MMLQFYLMWVAFVFAALQNARHVLPSPRSFATWEYLGAMVDFPIDSPEFVTWFHLSMLINLHTPHANPHRVRPVTCNGGDINAINLPPICCPDDYDL
jgi:hypothetical protein